MPPPGAPKGPTIAQGDLVCLTAPDGTRLLLTAAPGPTRVPNLGVVDLTPLLGLDWGRRIHFGPKTYHALPPTTLDRIATLERKAQIIQPKDTAALTLGCDIRAGKHVLEAGAGSGALTLALAALVAPTGHVTTVEIRQDFLDHARKNIERAGLAQHVTFHHADISQTVPPGPYDACILDLPDPQNAIPSVTPHLAGGAPIACYTPLVSQAENARRALAQHGYVQARTLELLERELIIADHGSRPSHDMLAHTAYLTFARRALD